MPMIYFFPWAKISGPLVFGSFHLAPFSRALASGEIPAGLKDAIGAVLEAYGFWRDVDRRSVPVLRHESATFTADLSDDEVAEHFRAAGERDAKNERRVDDPEAEPPHCHRTPAKERAAKGGEHQRCGEAEGGHVLGLLDREGSRCTRAVHQLIKGRGLLE